MSPTIAGAPVSFGVFELTPADADVVAPEDLLGILAGAGYDGVDLGPVGYLGDGPLLQRRLGRFGLELAGGWIQLPLTDDAAFAAARPAVRRALEVFRAACPDTAAPSSRHMALPTLADAGSAARRAAPGRGAEVDPIGDTAWRRLVDNARRAADLVRTAGFEPTFHHHAGTYVESPAEIERFLDATSIGLTLDVGHLAVAGADPVRAARDWAGRINHLHVKDVDTAALARALAAGGGMREVWSAGVFTALGRGDIDLASVLRTVLSAGFDGWIVVEQDVLARPGADRAGFRNARAADQRISRETLGRWL